MQEHLNLRSVVIKQDKPYTQGFNFLLTEPDLALSASVQAVWAANVVQSESIVKPLFADAGSGIIFNLFGELSIAGEVLPEGIIMLPVQI